MSSRRGARRRASRPAVVQVAGSLLGVAVLLLLVLHTARRSDAPRAVAAPVPAAYVPLVRSAAATCPRISAAVLGAQIYQESRYRPDAVSPAGAQGIAQFIPATWRRFGLDADHDGRADPFTPADAVFSAARYDCALYQRLRRLPGDHVSLTLAAYNAGPEAVERYRGVPPFGQTRAYVARITALAAAFASADGPFPAAATRALG